ncbi:hypothetical protein [Streptomyces sp. cg40]|uniref:hypothetical protein n=1 Tax=Streptomyces sp. cg40 TaxID=3419764 RepID=UPI003D048581
MRKIRPILATLALLGATTAACLTTGAAPAMATAAQCSGGANGFVDIPDSYSGGTSHGSVTLRSGATVTLMSDYFSGVQRGYARLSGSNIAGARVWMDWTQNGGSSWLQCGPFGPSGGGSLTSASKATSSSASYEFRACGDIPGVAPYKCTGWW